MDYLLGQIQLFPYDFAPLGWLQCNGQVMNIVQNTALYSLIGATFGGNGQTTFGIPNLTNTSPVAGMQYYICISGLYPMRD